MAITKSYQSPNQVTYDDLVKEAENRLNWLIVAGRSGWEGHHQIEVQKKIVGLLKKFRKDPQIDLFNEFEKQNKCGKKKLTEEMANKIIARDEIAALNSPKTEGLQKTAYFCTSCGAWHTSSMTANKPKLKSL